MENVIECRNLCHAYGKKKVLHGLNFSVEPGTILGLLGKNGAGKTTTINILMGFLQPLSGECSVMGELSHSIKPETRKRIGLLHEGFIQYDFMTIEQIEKFYSAFYPKWDRDVYYSLIGKLGLAHSHRISRMSCGQRSQITLGLILAQNAELMILDDYSMGLDAGYRRLFLDFLYSYVKDSGKTVLVTSHIVQDLERFVDDIIILDKGEVLVQSSLEAFNTGLKQYCFESKDNKSSVKKDDIILNTDTVGNEFYVYTYAEKNDLETHLADKGIFTGGLHEKSMSLEDAFIGITGKY